MHSTCVKHLQKDGYSEVTGIVHILERGLFLSVGWDRKITTFRDQPDVSSKKCSCYADYKLKMHSVGL